MFLGANDDSLVIGIDKEAVPKIKKDFITFINNAQKISPTFYLTVEEVDINNKTLLYIYVPESSQVHRCNGRIYDRNEDGDIDITENTNLVSALYMKKQGSYMENKIYPFANYQI